MIDWLRSLPIATDVSNFWPAVLLALGFPLVQRALTEAITASERRQWRFTRTLRSLRGLVRCGARERPRPQSEGTEEGLL